VNASAATATARHDVNVAGDGEEEIPLDKVPAAVKDAAIAAVPGLKLVEAEKEIENGTVVYNLEGTVNGVEYEIEVTADGKVTEIEKEDGDDADDDDDDDADDDDDDGMAQRR
jgi:hypothetical protein